MFERRPGRGFCFLSFFFLSSTWHVHYDIVGLIFPKWNLSDFVGWWMMPYLSFGSNMWLISADMGSEIASWDSRDVSDWKAQHCVSLMRDQGHLRFWYLSMYLLYSRVGCNSSGTLMLPHPWVRWLHSAGVPTICISDIGNRKMPRVEMIDTDWAASLL